MAENILELIDKWQTEGRYPIEYKKISKEIRTKIKETKEQRMTKQCKKHNGIKQLIALTNKTPSTITDANGK